jgi:hypothetical protein
MELAAKGENDMRTKLLAIAIALGSLLGAQQAVAKSSTKTTSTKKHHKHHNTKKTSIASMVAPAA